MSGSPGVAKLLFVSDEGNRCLGSSLCLEGWLSWGYCQYQHVPAVHMILGTLSSRLIRKPPGKLPFQRFSRFSGIFQYFSQTKAFVFGQHVCYAPDPEHTSAQKMKIGEQVFFVYFGVTLILETEVSDKDGLLRSKTPT